MFASRLAQTTFNGLFKQATSSSARTHGLLYKNFSSQSGNPFRRAAKIKTTVESSGATVSATPLVIGRGILAGASVVGIGALAYYGLGLSNKSGILERTAMWPQYIRDRVHSTYKYFGASIGLTAASAYAISRSPALMNIVSRNSIMGLVVSMAAVIGSGILVRSIPYQEGSIGSKHLAWMLHAAILGGIMAPLALLGGPLLARAAWYTAGTVGGLSAIAATAPSDKFLNMYGPLAIGMGLVFASSIGTFFFPPTTRLGLSLYSVAVYGGLVLFSMFILADTQRIVHKAENAGHFDPINESISIYINTLNIFMRMAMILAGNRKQK